MQIQDNNFITFNMWYLIVVFLVLCVSFYLYRVRNGNYWREMGIPTATGNNWFFGHFKDMVMGEKHFGTMFNDMYLEYPDAPLVGYLKMDQPGLMVRNVELIKNILTTDFNYFAKNDFQIDEKVDFLFGYNPFTRTGEEWKSSRGHLTPVVTFVKLKGYLPTMCRVGDEMVKFISRGCNDRGIVEIEAKELCGMYTTDVVANTVCGIDNNTFLDKDSMFATITREVFQSSTKENIKNMSSFMFPDLGKYLGIRFSSERTEYILLKLVRDITRQRTETGENRNDIFEMIINNRKNDPKGIFTDKYAASQVYTFLLDGYETSSILISYTLFELAWNFDIQERLRTEILEMLERTKGDVTAEEVEGLPYLNMVISESLRLHTPALVLSKICSSDYKVPEVPGLKQPVTIKSGTPISIPVHSLHRDPEYYVNPDKFDPERFNEESVEKRNKFVYLPFGEGPRKCFGQRFGLLQTRVAIIKLLSSYRIKPSIKSTYPPEIDPKVFFLLKPKNGNWVHFVKLNNEN